MICDYFPRRGAFAGAARNKLRRKRCDVMMVYIYIYIVEQVRDLLKWINGGTYSWKVRFINERLFFFLHKLYQRLECVYAHSWRS